MSTKNSEIHHNKDKDEEALRIDFNKKDTKKFRELQETLGIKNKSDVIRFCLTFTYENYPKAIQI
ncbi:MAG: hypothetical protein ACFFDN_00135 [Candidatus Hodarchaeota archaeon]